MAKGYTKMSKAPILSQTVPPTVKTIQGQLT